MTDSILITASEVAERLNICKKTVFNRASKQKIPYTKMGRVAYFSADVLSDIRMTGRR